MPSYVAGNADLNLLYPEGQQFMWNAETVAGGTASTAFRLYRRRDTFYPFGASFELTFGGAPGVFEVDIQTADTDLAANYVTINTITGGLNASNIGRLELPNFWARYVRAVVVTLTNAVVVTVKVTR